MPKVRSETTTSERGMALVAVLWITGLLALLAAGVGSSGRLSSRLAYNGVEGAKARLLAEAGVNKAIYDMLTSETGQLWPADGSRRLMLELDGNRIAVQVRDEDGKFDLNAAPPDLLAGLLQRAGLEEAAAGELADRIDDRRNGSSLSDEGVDQPFRQIGELLTVPGMTEPLFERLRPDITIYSEAEGIDPLRASTTALMALPGMTAEALTAVRTAAAFEDDGLSALPSELISSFEDYFLPSRELVFEVRALGQTKEGGRFLLETVVALDGGLSRQPFKTYLWGRGTLRADDPLLQGPG